MTSAKHLIDPERIFESYQSSAKNKKEQRMRMIYRYA